MLSLKESSFIFNIIDIHTLNNSLQHQVNLILLLLILIKINNYI